MEYTTKIVRKLVTIIVGEDRGIQFDRWLDGELEDARRDGYYQGFDEGHEGGYDRGVADGQEGGCQSCYDEGYAAGRE